ncbi:YqjF family protein [Halorussus sp. AFM4]|uniref:YqjF family protein n=1 Tax=Halorussus sp. AFM4 TaxID=3421651 RepID=UPI003EBD5AAE
MLSVPLAIGWRDVLFANWPVDPALVEPRIPESLEVDTRDGRAYLSVIPFVNVDVRPGFVPEGLGFRLPELNLRTYVRPDASRFDDRTPGVYFFNLDAGGLPGVGPAAVLGGRLLHALPYYLADVDCTASGDAVRFRSRRRHPGARPARFAATYGPTGEPFRSDPDSLAAFLTERYRLYTEDRSGALRYTAVDHPSWPLAEAKMDVAENTLFRADGFAHPESDPVCYYSSGVDVTASPSRRLDAER